MNKIGYVHIGVRAETKQMLLDCIKEYLSHHPEMAHIEITQDKILFEVCRYYLGIDPEDHEK